MMIDGEEVEDIKLAGLWALCQKFVKDNSIICPETIYQADKVYENAPEFVEAICDLVGYHKTEDDE